MAIFGRTRHPFNCGWLLGGFIERDLFEMVIFGRN